jgi:hypothetical protein
MKSRAIALGASVIALTLATGGQAGASGLGDLGQELKAQTQTSASGPAGSVNVNGNVKANMKAAVDLPSKGSVDKLTHPKHNASTTVEAKRKSGDDRSELVLDANSSHGVSAYVDQRRRGKFELEGEGTTDGRRAEATVGGFARHAGNARFHGVAKGPKAKQGVERSARKDTMKAWKADQDVPRHQSGHKKPLAALHAIGREVGNPLQPSLGGWLVVMAMGAGFGLSRLVRRLQHLN